MDIIKSALAVFLFGALIFLVVFALAEKDDACVKAGGTVIVVREHQGKGDMNHTECRS